MHPYNHYGMAYWTSSGLTAKQHLQVFLKRLAVRSTHRSKSRNTGRK